ncbi:hypothetical protein ACO0QE_001830 [Hanseniaspora vineae]
MLKFRRELHTSANLLVRNKWTKPKPKPAPRTNVKPPTITTHHSSALRITPPIPPSVKNLETSEYHPLWQFFSNKKYIRGQIDLDEYSRPWTVAELRLKSFDDLHSLWYSCLKELNILRREIELFDNQKISGNVEAYEKVQKKVQTTLWRIRHTLSERQWSYEYANQMFNDDQKIKQFLETFESEENQDVIKRLNNSIKQAE